MPPPPVDTTVPRGSKDRARGKPPSVLYWALIVLWSRKEKHREGQVGFLKPFTTMSFGRGGRGPNDFVEFGSQIPGAPWVTEGCLAGEALSRREFDVEATAVDIVVNCLGRSPVFFNGEVKTSASLEVGDIIRCEDEVVLQVVQRPLELPTEPGMRHDHVFGGPDADGIVGESVAAQKLRRDIFLAADAGDHPLLQGESGTGKQLAAQAIHRQSRRAKGPFVEINAESFPGELIVPELFGNLPNYPNPGQPARIGVVGEADGGTLFIDEIGDIPLKVQVALLKALDDGHYRPVGVSKPRRIDLRVIGATHLDFSSLRKDFKFRFKDIVHLPRVRDRREDIPLLIRHILRVRASKKDASPRERRFFRDGPAGELEPQVSDLVVEHLVMNPPEGNVRGIEAFLIRAMKASPGDVVVMPPMDAASVPQSNGSPASVPAAIASTELASVSVSTTAPLPSSEGTPSSSGPITDEGGKRSASGPFAREELRGMLERDEWNMSLVARRIGVHRNTLDRWVRAHGLVRGTGT
jgi:two-component system nitrogen regulation response regulator GlnG/two-component system response regulator HydG